MKGETHYLVEAFGRWNSREGSLILCENFVSKLYKYLFHHIHLLFCIESISRRRPTRNSGTLIFLHHQLLLVPMDTFDRPYFLDKLARIFVGTILARQVDVQTLEEITLLNREAIDLRPHYKGQLAGLEESISLHCKALELWPRAFWRRFNETGQGEDLTRAMLLSREAVKLCPHLIHGQLTTPHPFSGSFGQTSQFATFEENGLYNTKPSSNTTNQARWRPF